MVPLNIVIKELLGNISEHYNYAEKVVYDTYGRNRTIMDFICFWLFVVPSLVLLLIISLFVFLIRFTIYVFTYINETAINTLIANTFNYNVVADMLCNILRDNASVLEITAPNAISDILPTKSDGIQMVSRFTFFRYILHCPDFQKLSFKDMQETLNLKLQQTLQTHYCGMPIVYNDMPVITVLDITIDNYHPQCIAIDVMIIDSLPKYEYIKRRLVLETPAMVTPTDKDF